MNRESATQRIEPSEPDRSRLDQIRANCGDQDGWDAMHLGTVPDGQVQGHGWIELSSLVSGISRMVDPAGSGGAVSIVFKQARFLSIKGIILLSFMHPRADYYYRAKPAENDRGKHSCAEL